MRLIDQQYSVRKYLYDNYVGIGKNARAVYVTKIWEEIRNDNNPFFHLSNLYSRDRRISPSIVRNESRWDIRYFPNTNISDDSYDMALEVSSKIQVDLQSRKYIQGYLYNYPCPEPLVRKIDRVNNTEPYPSDIYIFLIGILSNEEKTGPSEVVHIENITDDDSIIIQFPQRHPIVKDLTKLELYLSIDNNTFYRQFDLELDGHFPNYALLDGYSTDEVYEDVDSEIKYRTMFVDGFEEEKSLSLYNKFNEEDNLNPIINASLSVFHTSMIIDTECTILLSTKEDWVMTNVDINTIKFGRNFSDNFVKGFKLYGS